MQNMLKFWFVTTICLFTAVTALSCSSADADEEAFLLISAYIEETTAVLEDLEPDLQGWVREPYSENLPLSYTEERRQWLREHKVRLEAIRNKYPLDDFPLSSEINQWKVIVSRGEYEKLLEGPKLVWAMDELDTLSSETLSLLEIITASDGVLDMEQSESVLALLEKLKKQVEEVKAVILL